MTDPATLVTNIGELMTQDAEHRVLRDAAIVLEGERITWIGTARNAPAADSRYDAGGRACLPGWVDSHTHLVFAGDRTAEFEARMAGESYAAGGISVTVEATRRASDEELGELVAARAAEAAASTDSPAHDTHTPDALALSFLNALTNLKHPAASVPRTLAPLLLLPF